MAPLCALFLLPLALAEPLLLTQIMAEGKGIPEYLFELRINGLSQTSNCNHMCPTIGATLARELSRVTIQNKTYGHSGYFTVPGC